MFPPHDVLEDKPNDSPRHIVDRRRRWDLTHARKYKSGLRKAENESASKKRSNKVQSAKSCALAIANHKRKAALTGNYQQAKETKGIISNGSVGKNGKKKGTHLR